MNRPAVVSVCVALQVMCRSCLCHVDVCRTYHTLQVFPSLESYMSVVILNHFCMFYNFILVFPFAVAVTFIIGISRVYSRSRSPHQIVGSWVTGLIGLVSG